MAEESPGNEGRLPLNDGTPAGSGRGSPPVKPASRWRSGQFDRARVPEIFHRFVPAHAADSLESIDLDRLWAGGKRLILMDVDHTLVNWKAEEFSPEILDWVKRAHALGFGLCIISNTRRVERLVRLVAALNAHLTSNPLPPSPSVAPSSPQGEGGVEIVRGRFKPSRAMFRLALIKFKCKAEQAVMIGDQLMTDILGANRSGIDAIWVRKMEGKEFVGTRLVNRAMEWMLRTAIYKGLITPIDEKPASPSIEHAKPLAERSVVHQFVKFGIVGVTSFAIDAGIRWYLKFHAPWHGELLADVVGRWLQGHSEFLRSQFKTPANAALPLFVVFSSGIAIVNSFIWNRLWTFEIRGKQERAAQFRRFVVVSVIGMLLNTLISSGLNEIIPGHPQRSLAIATVIATVIVAFWNFTGQRLYAFRSETG